MSYSKHSRFNPGHKLSSRDFNKILESVTEADRLNRTRRPHAKPSAFFGVIKRFGPDYSSVDENGTSSTKRYADFADQRYWIKQVVVEESLCYGTFITPPTGYGIDKPVDKEYVYDHKELEFSTAITRYVPAINLDEIGYPHPIHALPSEKLVVCRELTIETGETFWVFNGGLPSSIQVKIKKAIATEADAQSDEEDENFATFGSHLSCYRVLDSGETLDESIGNSPGAAQRKRAVVVCPGGGHTVDEFMNNGAQIYTGSAEDPIFTAIHTRYDKPSIGFPSIQWSLAFGEGEDWQAAPDPSEICV